MLQVSGPGCRKTSIHVKSRDTIAEIYSYHLQCWGIPVNSKLQVQINGVFFDFWIPRNKKLKTRIGWTVDNLNLESGDVIYVVELH